jgi:alginate O-acetyltransferase complex protein AlgJ
MLRAHRRYLGPVVAAFFILLMCGSLIPDPMGQGHPFTVATDKAGLTNRLNAWSKALSTYASDNFGFGRTLPHLRGVIGNAVGASNNPSVFYGRNGQLYWNGESAAAQSSGSIFRRAEIEHFVAVVDATRHALAPMGTKLVVMVPPNTESLHTRNLPEWWHVRHPLEYDFAISELKRRGIDTIDLKAAFGAQPDVDDLYRLTDTHWRMKGAMLAYNMAMKAFGRSDWSIDPATSLKPLAPAPSGDMARFLSLSGEMQDADDPLNLPPPDSGWKPTNAIQSPPWIGLFVPFAFERPGEGAGIFVLGDSFTQLFWQPLLMHGGADRFAWMHFGKCSFDFRDVQRFRPNYVIIAPTERFLPCPAKNWPEGLPHEAGSSGK